MPLPQQFVFWRGSVEHMVQDPSTAITSDFNEQAYKALKEAALLLDKQLPEGAAFIVGIVMPATTKCPNCDEDHETAETVYASSCHDHEIAGNLAQYVTNDIHKMAAIQRVNERNRKAD